MSEPHTDTSDASTNSASSRPPRSAATADQHGAHEANPWKTAVVGAAVTMPLVIAVAVAFAVLSGDEPASPRASATNGATVAHNETPSPEAIEDCNRYAAAATRDKKAVARDTLIGSAIGAGLGAATGAIADGGKGAGKGAGIGALVGATAGTAYGFKQEQDRTAGARAAYQECMARRGYN